MTDLPIYPSFHSATIKQGLSFEERARLASDAGYRATAFDVQGGLEFDREHGTGAAKGLLMNHGLEPSGWGGAPSVFASEEDFEKGLRQLEVNAAFAADAGAGNCAAFIPNRTDRPQDESLELVARRLAAIAEVLRDHGFSLGLEFCGPDMFKDKPFRFLTGVSGAMEIARASGAANIGVLADSFHLFCSGSTPEDIPALASGEVKAVHINDAPHDDVSTLLDADRVMPGDGVIPLTRFLLALDEAGYAGPAEVELFNPKYREIDPLDAATEARVKAESAIQTAFN